MERKDIRELRNAIRQMQRGLGWQWKSDAACCGVTTAQCHALLEISSKGDVSLAELAESLSLDKSTLSRTVDSMVEEGLLERRSNPGDRRYVSITLTEEGRKVCEDINNTFDHYYTSVLQLIPLEKRAQVLESIILLTDAVGQLGKSQSCCKEASEK